MARNCNHCMGGCIHSKMREVFNIEEDEFFKMKTFDHYEHYCDKNQKGFEQWWADNGQKKSDDAYNMDCYEPTELTKSLDNMIDLAQKIVDELEKK